MWCLLSTLGGLATHSGPRPCPALCCPAHCKICASTFFRGYGGALNGVKLTILVVGIVVALLSHNWPLMFIAGGLTFCAMCVYPLAGDAYIEAVASGSHPSLFKPGTTLRSAPLLASFACPPQAGEGCAR